jgi:hypothetical protein
LNNGGHEQDVKAMLELYDNPEELTFPDEEVSEMVEINGKGADKVAIKRMIVDKMATMKGMGADKVPTNGKSADKVPISDASADKLADIVICLAKQVPRNILGG